jgi:hypothetical protein
LIDLVSAFDAGMRIDELKLAKRMWYDSTHPSPQHVIESMSCHADLMLNSSLSFFTWEGRQMKAEVRLGYH